MMKNRLIAALVIAALVIGASMLPERESEAAKILNGPVTLHDGDISTMTGVFWISAQHGKHLGSALLVEVDWDTLDGSGNLTVAGYARFDTDTVKVVALSIATMSGAPSTSEIISADSIAGIDVLWISAGSTFITQNYLPPKVLLVIDPASYTAGNIKIRYYLIEHGRN